MTKDEVVEETTKHISLVLANLLIICDEIMKRSTIHDSSKLSEEELPHFEKYTPLLKSLTYGSEEYKKALDGLKPALDHHYKENRHHPEHFKNSVDDMNLVDLIEMFCDWCAATKRHADGDIFKSIDHNKNRFGISPQLCKIFKNSIKDLDMHCNIQEKNNAEK